MTEVHPNLATQLEFGAHRSDIRREFELLRRDLVAFERRLTAKLGAITVTSVCIAVALAKLL